MFVAVFVSLGKYRSGGKERGIGLDLISFLGIWVSENRIRRELFFEQVEGFFTGFCPFERFVFLRKRVEWCRYR